MDEIRYLISDASKKVDVETHVLRYWEEELGLSIPRNEMGHRYYTEFHIRLFCQVKELKDKGYQLKAIKNALQQVMNRNQEVVETEDVLERDITRTLEKNPRLGVLYRISVDKPAASVTKAVIEEQIGPRSLSGPTITNMSDYSRLEEKRNQEDSLQKVEKEEILERGEKDGRTDMKSRRKDRKKPSAWERRNGIVANAKDKTMAREAKVAAERAGEERQELKGDILEKVFETTSIDRTEEITGNQSAEQTEDRIGMGNWAELATEATAQTRTENRAEDIAKNREEKGEENRIEDLTQQGESKEMTALAVSKGETSAELTMMTPEEKMERFQLIMNHIIGQALEANNEKLSQEISGLVNQKIAEDLEDLMRIRDEREEERFRQLDETIRSCQRMSQGKAEAAATKVPFLKRKSFGRGGRL